MPLAQAVPASGSPKTITNTELASALIKALGIEMPEGTQNLSEAELFEVKANILAEVGINTFVDADAKKVVTKSDFCGLLEMLNAAVDNRVNPSVARGVVTDLFYDPITGYSETPPPEAGDYLVRFGCATGENGDQPVSAGDVISALNDPRYTLPIAEAYSEPEGLGRPPLIVPPQNPIPEDDPGLLGEEVFASITVQ